MKVRATVVGAVIVGIVVTLTGCSDAGDRGSRVYSVSDVEDFQPESASFDYYSEDLSFQIAGEIWESQGTLDISFEPAECRPYENSIRYTVLDTDESATADDTVGTFAGALADPSSGVDAYVSPKIRVFSSAESAQGFVNGLQSDAASCADGYQYWTDTAIKGPDSIEVSEANLPGVGNVLMFDERDTTAGRVDEPESMILVFAHRTHYVYVQGNIVFIATYAYNGDLVVEDDAAELIGQLIEHLG